MEVREIQERQNEILRLEGDDEIDSDTAAVNGVCFWLSEIALQLAKGREQKNETGI